MNDQRDIPLPSQELNFKVRIFAIIDHDKKQYEQLSTGIIQITTDQQQDQIVNFLQVKSQANRQVLLVSRIRLSNNYGTQKGTIISWTDPDQPDSEDIAISFQRDQECEIYWRMICQKVGKNYLEINGQQKLQMPNENNLQHILQKAKNSTDMVNYNIQHSDDFLTALSRTYDLLSKNNDQMGMGTILRIVKSLMSTYNLKLVQAFLRGQHFYMLLDLQTFKYNIKFKQIYQQNVGKYLTNRFHIPKQVFNKIQISHRATFYRQNALNLSQQGALQSSMLMISKQVSVDIISYLNKGSVLQKLINCSDYSELQNQQNVLKSQEKVNEFKQLKQDKSQSSINIQIQEKLKELHVQEISKSQKLVSDKVTFVLQAFAIYKHLTSENMKIKFIQKVYASGILQFVKNILNMSGASSNFQNQKPVQILIYICEADRSKFFAYLIDSFKNNATDNLLRTLTKRYISSASLRQSILFLIQSLIPVLNQKIQNLQFLNGTFLCLVFGASKDLQGVLLLIFLLISQLLNVSTLYGYLIKSKVFQKMATQYRSGSGMKSKRQQLLIIKILKLILIEQSKQRTPKVQQMEKVIIESGYLDVCMIVYLKHSLKYNILSSSMLQNFKLIQKMPYSLIDQHLIQEYATAEGHLQKVLSYIKLKYIEHQNQQSIKSTFRQIKNKSIKVHDQLLENQMEDIYLMGDANFQEQQEKQNIKDQVRDGSDERLKRQREELELQEMKRMRDQLSGRNQDQLLTNIRKQVKKSEDSKETAIFSFELPEWDQQWEMQNETNQLNRSKPSEKSS